MTDRPTPEIQGDDGAIYCPCGAAIQDCWGQERFEQCSWDQTRAAKQVIVMRKDLNMRKGKMVAQGAHASIAWLTHLVQAGGNAAEDMTDAQFAWVHGAFTKVCVGVDSEAELLAVVDAANAAEVPCTLVRDAGFTEFHGVETNTCCSVGPDWNERVDAVTGSLRLL